MIDVIAIWVLCFGVWPLADPGHDADTVASVLDIAVHWMAAAVLALRWRIVRRTS